MRRIIFFCHDAPVVCASKVRHCCSRHWPTRSTQAFTTRQTQFVHRQIIHPIDFPVAA